MTHDEVVDLLEELIGAYPYYASKIIDPDDTIRRWEREFGEYEASDIYMAARLHENTSKFFPSIDEIKGLISRGKIVYGEIIQERPVIEAPQAPQIMIPVTDNFCDLCGLCDAGSQEFCPCDF